MSVTKDIGPTENTNTEHRTNIIPFKRLKSGCILPFQTPGLEKPPDEIPVLEGTTSQGREIVRKLILIHKKAASLVQRQLRHEYVNVPMKFLFSRAFYRKLGGHMRTHKRISNAAVIRMVNEDEFQAEVPEEYRWSDDSCGYRHPKGRHFSTVPGGGGREVTTVTKHNIEEILENETLSYPGLQ